MLDAEGIDIAVLYPGLGLKLGGITDPELAVASCRVYNDWIAECARRRPDRLVGVGALPMQDPAACADEVRRIVDLGLRRGLRPTRTRTTSAPFHDPVVHPVYEALEETGSRSALHPAGLADMPGAARAWVDLDGAGHPSRARSCSSTST